MAMFINDECINCAACIEECPVDAIEETDDETIIDPDLCIECEGYFDEAQCVEVCPTDAVEKAE